MNEEALAHWGAVAPETNKHVGKRSSGESDVGKGISLN